MNVPTKQLKQVGEIICRPLMHIWNEDIIQNKKFPTKLKFADITPICKRLQYILVDNYRSASVLPVV